MASEWSQSIKPWMFGNFTVDAIRSIFESEIFSCIGISNENKIEIRRKALKFLQKT